MNATDHTVQFILETTWADLPPAVQHQAKRCLLDLIGALIAGTQTPVARLMAGFALEQCRGDEATVLLGGGRASAVGATLANGAAMNAVDADDGYRRVKGHPGACVLPALLAAAERRGQVTGQDFLAALVVGYEVGIRAGLIRHAGYVSVHASGSWGVLGAAAAAGRILGLNAANLREALGTAEYHAPFGPLMKAIDRPCMAKDGILWGGMTGLAAVLMAQAGFTGVQPLFDDAADASWVTCLGERYEILNLYFKPYACCRWAQPAVAGTMRIAREHHLAPQEIGRIRVYTFEAATRLSRAAPANTEEAQYNLAYPIAAILVDGELGPRQVLSPRIFDTAILTLASRVEAVVQPEFEAAFPAKTYAEVEILTADGRCLRSGPVQAPWEPPDALPTDAELEAKFHRLAAPVVGGDRGRAIAAAIWDLETADDVEPLIRQCATSLSDISERRHSEQSAA